MRWIALLLLAFLFFSLAPAEAQYSQYRHPTVVQEECPQGRQIRAQKPYPASMTDCQVLDADTAAQNSQFRQRAAASAPSSPPATQPGPPAPRSLNQEQISRLLDQRKIEPSATPFERSTLVSDPPEGENNRSVRAVAAPIYTNNLKDPTGQNSGGWIWTVVFAALGLYFLPAIIAANRSHHNALAIFALNLFLGWSFLGWVIAFVWACTRVEKRDTAVHADVLNVRREPAL
jgi:hypothetical protein